MKKSLLILALMLPFSATQAAPTKAAAASKASSTAAAPNPFTKERNQAAGNLSVALVTLQKMGNGCKNSGDLSEQKIKQIQMAWQKTNEPYLRVHSEYMNGLLASTQAFDGTEAAKKAAEDMKKTFNDQANSAIKTTIEKDGVEAACKKYFSVISSGGLDIKEGYPDFKTWKGMLDYTRKHAPAKK